MSTSELDRSHSLQVTDEGDTSDLSPDELNETLQEIELGWSDRLDAKAKSDHALLALADKALGLAYKKLVKHSSYLRSAEAGLAMDPEMLDTALHELWMACNHLRKVIKLS